MSEVLIALNILGGFFFGLALIITIGFVYLAMFGLSAKQRQELYMSRRKLTDLNMRIDDLRADFEEYKEGEK